jgi:hypothetical protein
LGREKNEVKNKALKKRKPSKEAEINEYSEKTVQEKKHEQNDQARDWASERNKQEGCSSFQERVRKRAKVVECQGSESES